MMNHNYFSCPVCKQKLEYDGELFNCSCGNTFKISDDIPDFLVDNSNKREMDSYFDTVPEYYESVNYLSKIYNFFGGLSTHPGELMVPVINSGIKDGLNKVLNPKNKLILDLACGTGMYARSLSGEASHIWAVDLSIEMLKQARIRINKENLDNITLVRADANELPFPESQFHGVSCMGAMQLFRDIDQTLAEIKRVMKDCGTLAVMTYVKEGVWKDEEHQRYLEELDIHFFEVKEIENLLKQNGFENFLYRINGSMIMFSCTSSRR